MSNAAPHTPSGGPGKFGTVSWVETLDYDPFGGDVTHEGAFSTQHRFTGQPADDAGRGLYKYGARFYNPRWGRFISPDSEVNGFDSLGFNRFAYVDNRPASLVDPNGREPVSTFLKAAGPASAAASGVYAVASTYRDTKVSSGARVALSTTAAVVATATLAVAGAAAFAGTGGVIVLIPLGVAWIALNTRAGMDIWSYSNDLPVGNIWHQFGFDNPPVPPGPPKPPPPPTPPPRKPPQDAIPNSGAMKHAVEHVSQHLHPYVLNSLP